MILAPHTRKMEFRRLVAGFQMKLCSTVFAIGLLAMSMSRLPAQVFGAAGGRVIDSVTHLGISGVAVEVTAAEGIDETVYRATTGSGRRVPRIAPGCGKVHSALPAHRVRRSAKR